MSHIPRPDGFQGGWAECPQCLRHKHHHSAADCREAGRARRRRNAGLLDLPRFVAGVQGDVQTEGRRLIVTPAVLPGEALRAAALTLAAGAGGSYQSALDHLLQLDRSALERRLRQVRRTRLPCRPGRWCTATIDPTELRLIEHPGTDPEAEAVAAALGAPGRDCAAEALWWDRIQTPGTLLWPYQRPRLRRPRAEGPVITLAALRVVELLADHLEADTGRDEAWRLASWNVSPAFASEWPAERTSQLLREMEADGPPWRPEPHGLGYPCGPWLNKIRQQVHNSLRQRTGCQICWTTPVLSRDSERQLCEVCQPRYGNPAGSDLDAAVWELVHR